MGDNLIAGKKGLIVIVTGSDKYSSEEEEQRQF